MKRILAGLAMALTISTSHAAVSMMIMSNTRGHVRHCDDACLYRLDQAEDARQARLRAAELEREERQRRMNEYKQRPEYRGPKPMIYGQPSQYTPPAPKPDGPHAERMRGVNILKKD